MVRGCTSVLGFFTRAIFLEIVEVVLPSSALWALAPPKGRGVDGTRDAYIYIYKKNIYIYIYIYIHAYIYIYIHIYI